MPPRKTPAKKTPVKAKASPKTPKSSTVKKAKEEARLKMNEDAEKKASVTSTKR